VNIKGFWARITAIRGKHRTEVTEVTEGESRGGGVAAGEADHPGPNSFGRPRKQRFSGLLSKETV